MNERHLDYRARKDEEPAVGTDGEEGKLHLCFGNELGISLDRD